MKVQRKFEIYIQLVLRTSETEQVLKETVNNIS